MSENMTDQQQPIFDRHFHLLFPAQLAERVRTRAAEQEKTLSEFIRQAIREHLDMTERAA